MLATLTSFDLWYLTFFTFGMLCAWAVIKGFSK